MPGTFLLLRLEQLDLVRLDLPLGPALVILRDHLLGPKHLRHQPVDLHLQREDPEQFVPEALLPALSANLPDACLQTACIFRGHQTDREVPVVQRHLVRRQTDLEGFEVPVPELPDLRL